MSSVFRPSSPTDRCHSLPSLFPPPAAVGSLPECRIIPHPRPSSVIASQCAHWRGNPFPLPPKAAQSCALQELRISVCGTRQKLRLMAQARFSPTATHTAPLLLPPLAAQRLVAAATRSPPCFRPRRRSGRSPNDFQIPICLTGLYLCVGTDILGGPKDFSTSMGEKS